MKTIITIGRQFGSGGKEVGIRVAKELGSRGIRVNAVAPGFIQTDMTDALSDEIKENAKSRIALGRFGKPEEIAEAVAFLASDKASYITGQVLSVDGSTAL